MEIIAIYSLLCQRHTFKDLRGELLAKSPLDYQAIMREAIRTMTVVMTKIVGMKIFVIFQSRNFAESTSSASLIT